MRNKILLSILCFTSLLSSDTQQIDRILEQTNSTIEAKELGDKAEGREGLKDVYNYQEVVYQVIAENETFNTPVMESKNDKDFSKGHLTQKEEYLKQLAEKAKQELKQIAEAKDKETIAFSSGYCYVEKEIEVQRMSTYAYLSCDLEEPIGKATVAIMITPDFYSRALIGTPLYVEKGGNRLPVVSGAVLTKDKNSINIANVINDYKVEKLLAVGTYTATSVVAKKAQEYLAMKVEASRQTQVDTTATIGGLNTTTATNTKEIPAENYIASATIELVSALSRVIGESVVENLPYTFKIYNNSILFVDIQVTDAQKIIGFGKDRGGSQDMIHKEPKFSIDGALPEINPMDIKKRKEEQAK